MTMTDCDTCQKLAEARAEVERLKNAMQLHAGDCMSLSNDRDAAIARAEKAEAELASYASAVRVRNQVVSEAWAKQEAAEKDLRELRERVAKVAHPLILFCDAGCYVSVRADDIRALAALVEDK